MKLENKKCVGDTKEIAKLLEVTPRRVLQFVEMGMPKMDRNKFNLIECIKWKAKNDVDELKKEHAEKDENKIEKYQARKEKALAELKEIELEKTKGRLVEIDIVFKEWERIITAAKNKILTWPQVAAPRVVGKGDLKEVKLILKKHVDEVLNDLAKGTKY